MSNIEIENRHEHPAQTAGSAVKAFAREAWSGQNPSGSFEPGVPEAPQRQGKVQGLPELHIMRASHVEHNEHQKPSQPESPKDHLVKSLNKAFDNDTSAVLKGYMKSFEARAAANQVSKQEVSETYRQIDRILSAAGNKPLSPELRKQVACESLRHCADPEIISQGQHNTCNVTAVQVRAYSLHPAKAAKVVADVATSGEYTTPGGIKVKLDALSMVPDGEARCSSPDKGYRDYATQLFNVAAVNVWYAASKPEWRYEQRIEMDPKTHAEHVREQIIDYSGGKANPVLDPSSKMPLDAPNLSIDHIAFVSDAIVGKHEPCAVLYMGSGAPELPGMKKQSHAADIVDEGHFKSLLQDLKSKHQLPAVALVETGVYPLNIDAGMPVYGYDNGAHVVNITDFAGGKNPHVSMDNSWSQEQDHPNRSVSLHDMFLCLGGAEVARNDANSEVIEATGKHLEAPVAEMTKLASDAHGTRAGSRNASDAGKRIIELSESEKALSGEDRTKWFSELRSLLGSVNPEDKVGLLRKIQDSGACSQSELGYLVAEAAKSISYQKSAARERNNAEKARICATSTSQIAEFIIGLPGGVKKHYLAKLREWQ